MAAPASTSIISITCKPVTQIVSLQRATLGSITGPHVLQCTAMSTNTHPDSPPKSKGIPIGEINPDFDGDGKISTLEREIFSKLVAADVDKSGYISSNELYGAITELVESKKRTKALGRLVFGLVVALILSMGCIFVTSIVAGETIKESHVGANGAGTAMTSKNGAAVQVQPRCPPLRSLPFPH